jgi:hypothetical protein
MDRRSIRLDTASVTGQRGTLAALSTKYQPESFELAETFRRNFVNPGLDPMRLASGNQQISRLLGEMDPISGAGALNP